jgi:hypothetical protein
MRVLIQALSVDGFSHLWRADRPWPTGEPIEVEVLDQDADPPPVMVEVPNSTTGKIMLEPRADPLRMGRASFALVKADKRMRIMQTADVNAAGADAAVQAAREEVQRMAGELADARVEIAKLKAEVSRLHDELDEATKPAPVSNIGGEPSASKGRAPSAPTTIVQAPPVSPAAPAAGTGDAPKETPPSA